MKRSVNSFDFWEGANFKLKIRKVDSSGIMINLNLKTVSRVKDTDDEIDKIWKSQYGL